MGNLEKTASERCVMSKGSSPTLEDVAKLAGVSTASISRALNEPGKVAENTRRRIDEAIENVEPQLRPMLSPRSKCS